MTWRLLAGNVWTNRPNECSTPVQIQWKLRQKSERFAMLHLCEKAYRVWNNPSPIRTHKRLWILSRREKEDWAAPAQIWKEYSIFLAWSVPSVDKGCQWGVKYFLGCYKKLRTFPPASLAMGHIFEFYLKSGVNLIVNRRSKQGTSLRVQPYIGTS